MSLTFKDYKINHLALLFIKVFTLSQKQVKIQNSVPSIGRIFSSIDKKNEEIHHKVTVSFDLFSILIQSAEKNIRSIERNSPSIKTMKNFIIEFLPKSIGSQFLFDQSNQSKEHSIDWKEFLIDPNLQKLNFSQNILVTVFDIFIVLPLKTPFDFINENLQIKH